MALLITDLDNTLYDWVSYFAQSFQAMVEELSAVIEVPTEQLQLEFKQLHQKYGDSERPFTILELPSVLECFGDLPMPQLRRKLERPLRVFSQTRERTLHLYPSVSETLETLQKRGVRIVAHTEARTVNAFYRLRYFDIVERFTQLYALESCVGPHPRISAGAELQPPPGFVTAVPLEERKPNPSLLLDVCAREGVDPTRAWYVGDSLTRDISMARAAGIRAVWARYGTRRDPALWDALVRITHWTDEDVARENALQRQFNSIEPDDTIDSFGELEELMA